jgi:hypothetical protein
MAKKIRIAVLGGGVGAMTAAFQLTREPDWREKYEITVYQRGWRLGGKGASGRGRGGRIEEHGLHVWGGYYDNAFRVLAEAYAVADRPASCPARDIASAFDPLASAWMAELSGDSADIFEVPFGTNDEKPGSGNLTLSAVDYLRELLNGLARLLALFEKHSGAKVAGARIERVPEDLRRHAQEIPPEHRASPLHAAAHAARRMPPGGQHRLAPLNRLVAWLMEEIVEVLSGHGEGAGYAPPARALLAGLHIGAACARGMIADDILLRGFDSIDDEEWTAWCMRHGAPEWAMRSAVGRCSYD